MPRDSLTEQSYGAGREVLPPADRRQPLDLNPRWANYTRLNGRSSDQQLAHDRERWPGGIMCGFVLWNRARLVEASRAIPGAFFMGRLVDHAAYDAWLTRWVDFAIEDGA